MLSKRALCLIVAAGLVGAACSQDRGTGPSRAPATLSFIVAAPPAVVRTISIQVAGPGIDTLLFNFTVDSTGTASGTLSVPAGANRRIVGRAFDSTGVNNYEGDTTLTLVSGGNPPLDLVLRPLNGSVPIVVTFGSYSITVTPGDTAILPGGTVQYSAAIVNEKGQPVNGRVRWSVSNPGVASVDTLGLATGTGPGQAQIVATFGGASDGSALTVTLDTALVLWWPLNGSAADPLNSALSGVGHSLVASADRFGSPGQATSFDGSSSFIDVPAQGIDSLGNGTIAVWVDLVSDTGTIVVKQNDGTNTFAGLTIGYSITAAGLVGAGTAGTVYWHAKNFSTGVIQSNTAVTTGAWHHIALVWTDTTAQLYIDGSLDNTAQGDFAIPDVATNIQATMGQWSGIFLNGALDDFRVYYRALSPAEIAALAQ